MELTLSTPALFFPTASLLLIAYTNRFLALSSRIRELHGEWQENPKPIIKEQINSLRARLEIIKYMQFMGVVSLIGCVLCMLAIFSELLLISKLIFVVSMLFMLGSLCAALLEIRLSGSALRILLAKMEE